MSERQIAGWAALTFGLLMVVGLALITPPFASATPAALEPANYEARVALISGLGAGQVAMLRLGFALEVIAALPLAVAIIALAGALSRTQATQMTIIGPLASISAVLFVVEHLPRFTLLQLAAAYAGAGEPQRTALGAGNGVAESLSAVAAVGFSVFVGATLMMLGQLIRRSSFPGWLGPSAVAVGLASLLAGLAGLADYELGVASFPALVLIVAWFIAAGATVLRSSSRIAGDSPMGRG